MKLSPRGRGASSRRRAWQVLEAPAEAWANGRSGDRTNRGGPEPRRAWGILEAPIGETPSAEADKAMGPALPDDATVHFVLDLALRIGEVQMATGAGASDVTATIIAVTDALGLPHCEVDVIYTSITASCHRGSELSPVTALRVVRARSLDYSRLSSVEELIKKITRGHVSAEAAYTELQNISTAPHPYPRWVATLALGGMAASVSVFVGGGPLTAVLAFFVSALIDRVGRFLNRYNLPIFFQQAVGGLIATLAGMTAVSTGLISSDRPTLVVAAAITVLLSGLGTVSAVQDAITGYNVTAAGRSMEVALLSAGLITGAVIALQVAVLVGLERTPLPDLPAATALKLPVVVLAGAATAGFFALASYSWIRPLLVAAVAGAVGTGAYGALGLLGMNTIGASAVAATVVGFGGGVMSRRLKVTPLVAAVSGITPLLPGLSTYRGLYELGVQPVGEISTLMQAIAIGLALAAGVVLGEYLAQPVRGRLGRLERRMAGPRLAGPLHPSRRRLE
ncbi:MAG: threonine/serine ThrE exporter family protein [Pseudonocardiaceae bacterium]